MTKPTQNDQIRAKGRAAGLVIAITGLLWVLAQWIGPKVGLGPRYAILVDLMALAAFVWALIVTFQMWRTRRDDEG